MNPNVSRPYRGPTPPANGLGPPPPRPSLSPRPYANSPEPASVPAPLQPSAAATRAQKYDDEKKRIANTCFHKLDDQGKPLQSYITHIRVEEDAVYQSSPPPPGHPPHHKKPRVIIVAVRNTGRVSMHKARENEDSSFQIGKTWPLEEMQSVESFSALAQRSAEDEVRARWAGPTGFIISMAKPYYWQANTAKEKDFFISSLVKIYNKYTEGKVPQLIGFEPRLRDEIMAATKPPEAFNAPPRTDNLPPPQSTSQGSGPGRGALPSPGLAAAAPRPPFSQDSRPISPSVASDGRSVSATSTDPQRPSVSGPRPLQQHHRPSPPLQSPPPQSANRSRFASPQLSQRPSQEQIPRHRPSQDHEQLRNAYARSPPPPPAGAAAPFASNSVYSGRQTPQGSRTNLAETAPLPPIISPRRQAERSWVRQDPNSAPVSTVAPLEPKSLSTVPTNSFAKSQDSNASQITQSRSINTPPPLNNGPSQALPERRRPPMDESNATTNSREVSMQPEQTSQGSFAQPRPYSTSSNKEPSTSPSILEALGSQELQRPPTSISRQADARNETSVTPTDRRASPNGDRDTAPGDIAAALPPSFSPMSTKAPVPPLPSSSPPPTSPSVISPPPAQKSISPPPTQQPTSPPPTTTNEQPEPEPDAEPQFRPGLGPMMGGAKRAEVASKFRKAVAAHTAFKPRAGGAGDRLFSAPTKASNEPDGITGVVPARSAARDVKSDELKSVEQEPQQKEKPPVTIPQTEAPSIQIDSPISPNETRNLAATDVVKPTTNASPEPLPQADRQRPSRSPKRMSKKRRSNPFESALTAMGVDPSVMQGRQNDFEDILNEFGWDRGFLQSKKVKMMETDLKREIDRLEAGSWLGHSDQKDDRVDVVEKLLNKTIAECEEMEGLLTLYSVELSTLNEDIAFIEAQSQGLQVQTANQKLLQTELQGLIDTISLNTSQLEPLRATSLSDVKGIDTIEKTLLLLYKALRTIDPASLNRENAGTSPLDSRTSLTSMRALQERKDSYLNETNTFLHRLRHYVDPTYGAAFHRTKDAFAETNANTRDMVQIHDIARTEMWRFSPLMLFAKEVNKDAWLDMIKVYQGRARETYQDELRQVIQEWKRRSRKMTGEEQEALFTAQEKESEGLTSTARKLTVKRSQTLAKGLRQTSAEKKFGLGQRRDGNQYPFEIFTGTLTEVLPVIATEQNFFVDFFHTTTLEGFDFPEAVAFEPPAQRRGTDWSGKRSIEPDRDMSRRVVDSMEGIFASLQNEMQSLIDWAVKQDQFQCIGILYALERAIAEHSDTSQEFIFKILTKLHDALGTVFTRFVDDQIRAIEATKVNIKKRKGVMAFIKVFPNFSALIENMVPAPSESKADKLQVRTDVDTAYERINKAMFSSLKQIAKEGPHMAPSLSTPSTGGGMGISGISNADAEDKEALNHEILLIENMYYYYSEVDEKSSAVLGAWRGKAMLEMSEHQDRYVGAVIRRPLGRLLDFIEGVEALLLTAHADPKNIPTEHPSFSRAALKKMLASHYDARECRRGVDALRKRIDKHFGESSEHVSINQRLMTQMLGDCERKYADAFSRLDKLVRDVYGGDVDVEFSRADISTAFKR